ncbi:hypothetical protein H9Y05_03525 [Crocinitomicaceae bacterium CZZ-1]|uniref:Uncharacterized protein n=1 Tax=Taishania pollutisoli TaxID=2766479 RepID=A0A8J6P7S7_9FLAO|nr:hypothetical protein [Taishania pollutisoli]MBC9811536.1 hypothetical protein [Taishania pollutisoli]
MIFIQAIISFIICDKESAMETDSSIEFELNVIPGFYKFRIYGFDRAIDDDGNDYYRIEIWSDRNTERKVLKQIRIQHFDIK